MPYKSLTDMWLSAGKQLLSSGATLNSRNGDSLEILNWQGTLTNIEHNFVLNAVRKADPAYAAAEFLWYMSAEDHVGMMLRYAPQYSKFAEDDGIAYGAYGPRIVRNLGSLISLLRTHPNTRQAVIVIWRPSDICEAHIVRDIPCTVALQFLVRDGQLHCITFMRSNDLWLGMPYDVFCFTMLQRYVADHLGLRYGCYHHCVGSMHVYHKDVPKMSEALDRPVYDDKIGHHWDNDLRMENIETICTIEKEIRLHGKQYDVMPNTSAANDLLICCYKKLWPEGTAHLETYSDILCEAWEIKNANH